RVADDAAPVGQPLDMAWLHHHPRPPGRRARPRRAGQDVVSHQVGVDGGVPGGRGETRDSALATTEPAGDDPPGHAGTLGLRLTGSVRPVTDIRRGGVAWR